MAGKTAIGLTYKEWQIVKHALQHQIDHKQNYGPIEDIPAEERLLSKVQEQVERTRTIFKIKGGKNPPPSMPKPNYKPPRLITKK